MTSSQTDVPAAVQKEHSWHSPTLIRALLFIVPTIITSALASAVLGQKITLMYKEQLGLTASDLTGLAIFIGIPSYAQPFIGVWTDMFAFFGYHRRSYYMAGKIIGAAALLALAFYERTGGLNPSSRHRFAVVIALMLVIASGGIIRTVIFNAIMVAVGNVTGRFGQLLAAVSLIPIIMSITYTSGLDGYVAANWSYQRAFTVAAIITILSIPLVFLIEESRSSNRKAAVERTRRDENRKALVKAGSSVGMWALVAFVFYLILTPGNNVAKYYYMRDGLNFSKQFIGDLGRYTGLGALAAYFLYGVVSRRIPVYMLATGAWLMDCFSYPLLLALHTHASAKVIYLISAIIGALYSVCLYTLAARMCPKGLEGVVYGLVMAAIALGSTLSEKLGGWLYDYYGPLNTAKHYTLEHGWFWSIYVGLAFTLVGGVLIPFLPKWTRSHKRVGDLTDEDVEAYG